MGQGKRYLQGRGLRSLGDNPDRRCSFPTVVWGDRHNACLKTLRLCFKAALLRSSPLSCRAIFPPSVLVSAPARLPSLGKVLLQKTLGVFVEVGLLRTLRIAATDREIGRNCEPSVILNGDVDGEGKSCGIYSITRRFWCGSSAKPREPARQTWN